MEDSPVLNSAKRKGLEDIALEDGSGSHKRLKRQLTQESDLKVSRICCCVCKLHSCLYLTEQGSGRRAVEVRPPSAPCCCRGLSGPRGLKLVLVVEEVAV